METLWSMSTTVREAERIIGFLKTAMELDGEIWDQANQERFQVLLIKNRQYLNDPDNPQCFHRLNDEQAKLLKDKSISMTDEEARGIFDAKRYQDPPMRGRQSMSPLTKLGLVYIVGKKRQVQVSDVGHKLAEGQIEFSDFMLDALLKFQYPNPYESGFKNWNTKPFINTLRLIKQVNALCRERGEKEKGISKIEFGIFALSLPSYTWVDRTAERIMDFRRQYEALHEEEERDAFVSRYIKSYLPAFKNPEKNVREYTDNMIRYMRLTKYIYIRGKYANTYIDLEPRRRIEIDAILAHDPGRALPYSRDAWREYMGTYGTYELPFETLEKLTEIGRDVQRDIYEIEQNLGMSSSVLSLPETRDGLKAWIDEKRAYRTYLQNLEIKRNYHGDVKKIDETVEALEDIRKHNKAKLAKRFSIELEKWSHVALNIINDSKLIKPNAPVGDDNEPTYTAPNNVPDIECYYDSFAAICEVNMLTSRDQWYNEGQPVMRHLRQFENHHEQFPGYCLFVAPSLHVDTVNTFYIAVKYEYEGRPQKIIPITIIQLESILRTMKELVNRRKTFRHQSLMELYDRCTNVSSVSNSTAWLAHIDRELKDWEEKLLVC